MNLLNPSSFLCNESQSWDLNYDNNTKPEAHLISCLPYQTQAWKRYCNLPPSATGQQMILSGRKDFHTQLPTER